MRKAKSREVKENNHINKLPNPDAKDVHKLLPNLSRLYAAPPLFKASILVRNYKYVRGVPKRKILNCDWQCTIELCGSVYPR